MNARPKLYVTVGLPGTGKTTRARQIERDHQALRLTPDEWMPGLFEEPDADGKRDVLEGRLLSLAVRALHLGLNVVLDFGLCSRDERSALRWLAGQAGAAREVVYLEVTEGEQRRVEARNATESGARYQFQVPGGDELGGGPIDAPPAGYVTWESWASSRWPSFVP